MSWHDHVATIAKTASQKLGVLFRCRKLYTPEQLLLLYKAQIRPSLEYCSHVWGCAPKHSLKLLDSIQNRAVKLIDTDNLTNNLHSLEDRRRVAGLSLFYRFYHGRCSSELSQIITPKAVRTRRETLCMLTLTSGKKRRTSVARKKSDPTCTNLENNASKSSIIRTKVQKSTGQLVRLATAGPTLTL
nr:unnamed protein product [Callosobruchus analis]